MGSSRHTRILADLLGRGSVRAASALSLAGAPRVSSGGVVSDPAGPLGQLDVFMEAETLGTWLAGVFLPVYVPVAFEGAITSWQLLTDSPFAELTVEVVRDTALNHPPTIGDKITGTTPPSVVGLRAESATLTGWSAGFYAGDVLRFLPSKIWLCTQATLSLRWTRV